jgi:SNF2-related domain
MHILTLANFVYSRCIDISQGVDRDMDTRPLGIMGCITPSGMLYSTARGGQIQGREMLAMQGMPLSRISLTRENQAQMQDLAGNAMSTTVVGPAIIAALMTSHSLLKIEPEEADFLENEEHMPVPSLMDSDLLNCLALPVKLRSDWLVQINALAALTVSLCSCEGPFGIGRYGLYRCVDCKFTACAACKVNPVHNYQAIPVPHLCMRKDPKIFRELLLWNIPSTIQPPELPMHIYEAMSDQYSSSEETMKIWKLFLETVELVCLDVLMYKSIKRTQIWKVVYEGSHSILHLTIDRKGMHWTLFAKAPANEPAKSHFREIIRHPIARMKVDEDRSTILEGQWQVCKPLSKKEKTITLKGTGDLQPSYENICGLPGSYQDQTVWSNILVESDDEAMKGLSLDIRGNYERIPNCGGVLRSLHRRDPKENEPTLFLFLDPRRLGPSQLDSWVFSMNPWRKTDDTPRDIILQLDSQWEYQQLRSSEASSVRASYRQWIDAGTMSLINCDSQMAIVNRILKPRLTLEVNGHDCYDCYLPLLSVSTKIIPGVSVPWEQGPWRAVEISNFEEINKFAWIWAKFMTWSSCTSWRSVNAEFEICERCSPQKPRMAWTVIKGKERPIEDPVDAARCERDYKLRPSPFCLFTKIETEVNEEDNEAGHVCLAVNFKTMFHRACGTIAHRRDGNTPVDFYWRVTSNDDTDIPRPGSYRVLNNNDEPNSKQPPHFRVPLRSDQRRSLRWVLSRESDDMEAFPEEEVEEAVLEPLTWRAEAKVIVHRKVRGGIIADHVGFGKTAVVLGLIDCQHEKDTLEAAEPCDNAIPLKATCIIVPDILFDQWQGEISRFLGEQYTILAIESTSKLEEISIQTFQSADIVLVSWAVFSGGVYFDKLEGVAGGPSPPKTNSNVRMFEAWFDDAIGSVETQVSSLQRDGTEAFLEAIQRKKSSIWGTDAYNRYSPSRRLRGKAGMAGISGDVSSMNQGAEPVFGSSISADIRSSMARNKNSANTLKRKKTSSSTLNQEAVCEIPNFGISKNEQTSMGDVKGTVLHMYRFQRLVIDEFTYLDQDRHALLASLKARSRWIMSGTPPIKGFAAAEKMARLLNVYLGKSSEDDYEKSKYKRSGKPAQSTFGSDSKTSLLTHI